MADVPSWVPAQYQSDVAVASAQWGVPASILAAVLSVESGFNPNAQSGAGAQGIAQFEPGTAAEYGVNPWDAQSSINGAAHLLSDNYAKYHSWPLALAAYNGGPGAISNGQASAATAQYATTVLTKAQTADKSIVIGQGSISIGDQITGGLEAAGHAATSPLDAINTLVKFFGTIIGDLTNPAKWKRLGLILMGAMLVIGGIYTTMNGLGGGKGGGKVVPIPV